MEHRQASFFRLIAGVARCDNAVEVTAKVLVEAGLGAASQRMRMRARSGATPLMIASLSLRLGDAFQVSLGLEAMTRRVSAAQFSRLFAPPKPRGMT
jgi:hypothetical protein